MKTKSFWVLSIVFFLVSTCLAFGDQPQETHLVAANSTNYKPIEVFTKNKLEVANEISASDIGVIGQKQSINESMAAISDEEEKAEKDLLSLPRHFLFGNSLGLEKGTGYFQNVLLIFNNVQFGISDNFSLGGGLFPGFLFGDDFFFGDNSTPLWLLPSLSIPVVENSFSLGINGMFIALLGGDASAIALINATATYGNHRNNVTFGLGYGYAG
jgi:hypothetical protein